MSCPLTVIACLQAQLPFTAEYEGRIDAYIAKSDAERAALKAQKGSSATELHSYSLEDYGLSKDKVLERFGKYIEKYQLRSAKAK